MHEVAVSIPRNAFSPREAPRAGDVWRALQDVAVAGSIEAGWPPARYRAERVSFVVRSMVVRHHREPVYGEALVGRTWPSHFRRGMFFRRECRLDAPAGSVADATQEWVHVTEDLTLARASDALVDAFPVEHHDAPVALPPFTPLERAAPEHAFELECWHTWMDPLGHANHPAYVDFADEAISRAMEEAGLDPVALAPVAEALTFRSGVRARERVRVAVSVAGTADDAVAFAVTMSAGERLCAKGTLLRRMVGDVDGAALLALA